MPDEATTYNVVGYDDVRGIAVDAASTALDRHEGQTVDDLRSVADAAADAAVSSVSETNVKTVTENMEAVADAAASKSLEGVQEQLDQQLRSMEEQQEQTESQVVVIDAEQYAWMQETVRGLMGAQLVTMILVACLCGLTLWESLARRFI